MITTLLLDVDGVLVTTELRGLGLVAISVRQPPIAS